MVEQDALTRDPDVGRQQPVESEASDEALEEPVVDTTTESKSVTLVIPTYNERENVEPIVDRCLGALSSHEVEIVIVDDDSPDGTWRIARDRYTNDDRVRIIRRTEESGLGTAVLRGFSEASHEFCAVIDADLQHPPEKLPALLDAFDEGIDVVVGSRHVEGGGIEGWSRFRRVVSDGATSVARLGVPEARGISDPMSGFFAVRREVLLDADLNPKGYKILLEVLAKCDHDEVAEVPYVFTERERGESNLTHDEYVKFVEHVLMLGVSNRGLDRFVDPERATRALEFGAVGAIGVLVNTLVFMSGRGVGLHYLTAATAAFIAAVHWNFVGNWLVTFDQPEEGLFGQYLRFNLVSVSGYLIYTALLVVAIQGLGTPDLIANLAAIGGSSLWNFLGAERFAFISR
jgi:dolichol-phosphate mannosyltransferase